MGNWTSRTVKVLCADFHTKMNGKIQESFHHLPITGNATIHYTPNDKYDYGIGPDALIELNGFTGMKELIGSRWGLNLKVMVYAIDLGDYAIEFYTDLTVNICLACVDVTQSSDIWLEFMCSFGHVVHNHKPVTREMVEEIAQREIESSRRSYGQEMFDNLKSVERKYFGSNNGRKQTGNSNSEQLKPIPPILPPAQPILLQPLDQLSHTQKIKRLDSLFNDK